MFTADGKLMIAHDGEPIYLLPQMCNRHGIIAGATGTGKTVTLKVIAESLSDAGVPVFLADIKGDVTGVATAGNYDEISGRAQKMGLDDFTMKGCPVHFWDVYGEKGIPVRTTVSEMGPMLLARILDLNEVQSGVLNIVFHVADDLGLELIDIKDMRAMLTYVSEHADEYTVKYGNVASTSVGAIQRALLALEDQGGNYFFGEPGIDINDWFGVDEQGRGIINVLNCVRLFQQPKLYSTYLLWMLSEIYEMLPEVGDVDKPKMVFFFDEAHTLFDETSSELVDKIERVIKLIRSKGVGIFFVTQNPTDIHPKVLGQLGNRVQHALRAYTPAELKALKSVAETFRENPDFDTEQVITELGTGAALVSFLDEEGVPGIVRKAKILPPQCSMEAMDFTAVAIMMAADPLYKKYVEGIDRESAFEVLTAQAEQAAVAAAEEAAAAAEEERLAQEAKEQAEREKLEAKEAAARAKEEAAAEKAAAKEKAAREKEQAARAKELAYMSEKIVSAALGGRKGRVGGAIARGLLGTFLR